MENARKLILRKKCSDVMGKENGKEEEKRRGKKS